MKKLFFYLSVAMLAVAAVSCQKEMVMADGENGNVTLTIQTPEVATKAIADGMNVDIVYYEIYKAEAGHKNSLSGEPLIKNTVQMTAKGASLTLNLLQGQEYVGLFWAQVDGKSYYDTSDLRNVTVSYSGNANVENRAAFCKSQVFSTGRNVKVVLERPFAQINLGTTMDSIDPVINGYEIAIENSTMEIVGAATTFNVATMTTGTEPTTVKFVANTVPHNFTPSEVLTVNNVNYAYLGMNYILAPNNKATVDVKYTVSTDVGSITRQIPTVPVEKNHRTNLLGNLLTQETAIQIIVDERFAEPDLAPEAIYMAAAMGGEFTLTEDLVLKAPVVVPANSNFVLNLNGKSIKNTTQSEEFGKGEAIIAYGNLTINGEGDVEGSTMAVWARGTDGARVTINGGTYKGCAEGFAKGGRSVIYASSGNVIDIYGGRFESLSADKSSYANTTEGVYAALNVADNNGMINVYGGTFVKQNPAAPGTEPAAWNAAHPNGFVAEGYKAVEKSGVWHVVAAETNAVVLTADEFKAALAAEAGNTTVVIDANGAEFDMNGAITQANVPAGTTVTIRNANVNARSYGNKLEGTVVYENCSFNNAAGAYSIHFDGGNGHVIFKNCDLYGWNSFGYIGSVTFENCTLNGNGTYALIRSYTAMTLTNCTINLSNAIHDDEWPEGIEAIEGGTLTETNVVYVVDDVTTLQYVLDNAKRDVHVAFNNDLVGDATVSQNKDMSVVIDGNGKKFNGTVFVYGNSAETTKPLTVKNVNFESDTATEFIHSDAKNAGLDNGLVRYANINVENCSFVGTATDAVAIRTREAYKITVKNCVATLDHSFLQAQSSRGIIVENVKVNANRGFNLGNSNTTATFTKCEINATKADGYGIRFDAGSTLNVTGCEITAYEPIVFRACTSACVFNLSSSELTTTGDYHVVVTSGSNPSMNGVTGLNVQTL